MIPIQLKCQGFDNPLGMDVSSPVLSWKLQKGQSCKTQKAWRILMASSPRLLEQNAADVWDSGWRENREQMHPYGGRPLQAFEKYFWKVLILGGDDLMTTSDVATFEMGPLSGVDWGTSCWICQASIEDEKAPLPVFRKEFKLRSGLKSARLFVSGLGHYEFRLNGKKVGNRLLEPGWTNYRQSCFFSSYDITPLVRPGTNAAGVLLGNGFFNLRGGGFHQYTHSFGPPQFIALLRLQYDDGLVESIHTDRLWTWSPGPVIYSNVFGGETHDAREEQAGWDTPDFTPTKIWSLSSENSGPGGKLKSQPIPPLVSREILSPITVTRAAKGGLLVDLGQNASAIPEIRVKGPAGSCIRLMPGEWMKDGVLHAMADLSPEKACHFVYTLRGDGEETWMPRFTYYGYRWILIEGASFEAIEEGPVRLLEIRSHVVYPDIGSAGAFKCSLPLLNRIHHIIRWAMISNIKSVFTDCPHREKLGWLEETYLMAPALLFNFDLVRVFAKVLSDMSDAQMPNGFIPNVVPEFIIIDGENWKIPFRDSPEWGSAQILAAWDAYEFSGDLSLLRDHYGAMKKYFDFLDRRSVEGGLLLWGLSDWMDVGAIKNKFITPLGLTATCIFYRDAHVLEEVSRILGHEAETARFSSRKREIASAFHRKFFNAEQGCYGCGEFEAPGWTAVNHRQPWTFTEGSQCSQAMPLLFGMVPEEHQVEVWNYLVKNFEAKGCRVTAGDVGTVYVLRTLAGRGRSDLIFRSTLHTDHPSYGFQVEQGATTLTEAWDGPVAGNSQNHFMIGHIDEWFYTGLGGIRFSMSSPERLVLAPYFAPELEWVEVSMETPFGTVASHWKRKMGDKLLMWNIEIPPNLEARVEYVVQGQKMVKTLGSGTHRIDVVEED